MAEARRLDLAQLRELVRDPNELAKGSVLYDEGRIGHLARYESKLFADALGGGASPYKVQVTLGERVVARCTCGAALSRPICKHAAALLIAWTNAPESFAVSDSAPETFTGEKKREVKRGKSETAELMRLGIGQASTLVRELMASGITSVGSDRVEQVRALGANLREHKLRRLSGRTVALASMLDASIHDPESLDASVYADLLADVLLTSRKLEKHLAGEPLEERYVEELIGKTWRKTDRKPLESLKLVEYAFFSRLTADDYVIRESRFFDLTSGAHFTEKQIIPGFLAKRTEAKRSWFGRVLDGATAGAYPGFSPLRLDLTSPGTQKELDDAALSMIVERSLPDVHAALAAYQERRRDVFAPDRLPVAIRVDTILAEGLRAQLVDAKDGAIFLPDDSFVDELLAAMLRGTRLSAILGELGSDGALPTLFPSALIVKTDEGLELRPVRGAELPAEVRRSKRKKSRSHARARRTSWADAAREAGLSDAAIALGEVREELASIALTGLGAFNARFATPLADRLRELGLEKQADVLAQTGAIEDAAQRLDGFVKLYQVLELALIRLTGAAHVDRTKVVAVPTFDSVFVRAPERDLPPDEVANLVRDGAINRYQAAVHYARWYEALPSETLATSIMPAWADGAASPYVARAFMKRPSEGVSAAKRVLAAANGRVAWLTAIRVLERVGGDEASRVLMSAVGAHKDPIVRKWAGRALASMRPSGAKSERTQILRWVETLLASPQREMRTTALSKLEALGDPQAIPWVRVSFAADPANDVRAESAYVLARLGDTESADTFARMLRARHEGSEQAEQAKVAAHALGHLGDVRGVVELLAAYREG